MAIEWRLRQLLAERDMWHTTQLHAATTDRAAVVGGRTWSKPQIYRLVAGRPDRLNLELLDALCAVLDCTRPAHPPLRTEHMMGFWDAIGHWMTSPGFGGFAAVVAASIAYTGVARSVRAQRDTTRKQQWWERARWALDLTLSDDSTTRTIGLEVLDALGSSEFASEHEFDLVHAATAPTLEAYASTIAELIPPTDGESTVDEAHLESNDEEGDCR